MKLGQLEIEKAYMGTNEVNKMYLGSIEINLGGNCDEQCQCEQAGGYWLEEPGMQSFCDCNLIPECECVMGGGTWDASLGECVYN